MTLEHMSKYAHFLRGKARKVKISWPPYNLKRYLKSMRHYAIVQGTDSPIQGFIYFKNKTKRPQH